MIRPASHVLAAASLLLAACSAPTSETPTQTQTETQPQPQDRDQDRAVPGTVTETRVLDRAALERLLANTGVTLQWIDWNTRGTAHARWDGQVVRLTGDQARGGGRLHLDGVVEEIGADYFTFRGTILIEDAPDAGRRCERDKSWRFAVTQNRPYWRLREFEWCDGLTDYIDIYFRPTS